MKISRTVAYAVQAVLQLAQADADTPVPCSQLAKEGRMPERFLLQILRNLVTHQLLRSTRGVEGGYALARPAAEITLFDVIEAVDGPLIPSIPPLESLSEPATRRLSEVLHRVTAAARRELSSVSLADLQSESVDSTSTSSTAHREE